MVDKRISMADNLFGIPDKPESIPDKPARIRVYGWKSVQMAKNLTLEELDELTRRVKADSKNAEPRSGSSIYTAENIRKLEAIDRARYYIEHGTFA